MNGYAFTICVLWWQTYALFRRSLKPQYARAAATEKILALVRAHG